MYVRTLTQSDFTTIEECPSQKPTCTLSTNAVLTIIYADYSYRIRAYVLLTDMSSIWHYDIRASACNLKSKNLNS